MAVTATDPHGTIDAVWRIESAKIIAFLARMVGDVGLAEELAQDALVAALEQWPTAGVPANPGAWLTAIAKRRAVDHFRRAKVLERKQRELGIELEASSTGLEPDDVDDDLLRLIFTACHPVLSTEARVALTLRLVGGLTTAEIARAFLVPEPTVAQRIVRAKRTLAKEHVPMAFGPEAGLTLVGALGEEPSLAGYHLLPAVRGDLLARLGRSAEAATEFERAATLTRNARERAVLLGRARDCSA